MALNFKVGLTHTKTEMYISDITGDYNAVTNPTGWGAPNTAHTAPPVNGIFMDITDPNTTVYSNIDIWNTTFFTAPSRAYALVSDPSNEVPGTIVLMDGVWKYELEMEISGVYTTYTFYSFRDYTLRCTLAKMALENNTKYIDVKFYYDKLQQAIECEDYTLAAEIYADIQKMLTDCYGNYSCGCGC
jgi:hypothetical protein